jgi:hypothetical protein
MRKATPELQMGSIAESYMKPSFRGARSAQIDEVNFALAGEPGIHNHDWGLWIPGLRPRGRIPE